MEAVLLRRFVEEISRNNDVWSGRALEGHDLDDFAGYSNAEIEIIAALFCEKHKTPRDTALGGEEEDEDLKLDDDDHQMIDDPELPPAMTTLDLDGLPEDLIVNLVTARKLMNQRPVEETLAASNKYQTLIKSSILLLIPGWFVVWESRIDGQLKWLSVRY
jgi:hypothetical protein